MNRKLHPIWHITTLKDMFATVTYNFDVETLADYGGIGVDVIPTDFVDEPFSCVSLRKEIVSQKYFPKRIRLPFLPPNNYFAEDPCLKNIEILLSKQSEFAGKLLELRKKSNTHQSFLTSLHKILSSHLKSKTKPMNITAIPQCYFQMADIYDTNNFPAPSLNWFYSGGCLKVIEDSNQVKHLIRPGGPDLNTIISTVINENQDSELSNFSPSKEMRINLKDGGVIYQIANEDKASEKNFCAVRQKHLCHILSLNLKKEKCQLLETFNFENEQLSSLAISPYVGGELAIMTANGNLSVFSASLKRSTVWENKEPFGHQSPSDVANNFWQCSFGAHPRSILVLDQNSFSTVDIRSKHLKQNVLFDSDNYLNYKWDQFTSLLRNPNNEFQHFLTSKHHLYLTDERYPKQTIFIWNHLLESPPLYIDYFKTCEKEMFLFLTSQRTSETCCFNLECVNTATTAQPISLSPPWHVPSSVMITNSILNQLENKCGADSRLKMPIIGLTAIQPSRNPKTRDKFTIFHSNSFGDVFYQDFQTEETTTDSQIKYNNEIETFSCWVNALKLENDIKLHKRKATCWLQEELLNVKTLFNGFTKDNVSPSKYCPVCLPQEETTLLDDNLKCLSCGLNIELATNILRVQKQKGVLLPYDLSNCHIPFDETKAKNTVNLEGSYDPLSNSILQVWSEPPEVDQSQNSVPEDEEMALRELLYPKMQINMPNMAGCSQEENLLGIDEEELTTILNISGHQE